MSERIYGDGEERWIHNGTSVSDGTTSQQITNENGGSPSYRPQSSKQSNRKSNAISEQLTSQEIREIAQRYNNFGSALKPAHEPIVMARKPLSEKSIAENVLKHGTGGINIDGSRIGFTDGGWGERKNEKDELKHGDYGHKKINQEQNEQGRFPANIIFDEEAGQLLDEQSGERGNGWKKNYGKEDYEGLQYSSSTQQCVFGGGYNGKNTYSDKGGASRFFYCPKTSKSDRNEGLIVEKEKNKRPIGVAFNNEDDLFQQGNGNNHPTVKPTDLMRYLINLITPPNGTTLDPFMGSGSTGKAAIRCGVNFIGIEKEQEYMDIASARIQHEQNKPVQQSLF
jgi:site-specific DNA-methyltransferase (adenine-specific)